MQTESPSVQTMDWLQAHQILEAAIRAIVRRQPRRLDDATTQPEMIAQAIQLARANPQLLQLIGLAAVNAVDNNSSGKGCGTTGLEAMRELVRHLR